MPAISDQLGVSVPGSDNASITGSGTCRPFTILSGTSVTIQSLRLRWASSADNGGAIHNLGSLRLFSCLIDDCMAASGGGAEYTSSGSNLTMESCTVALCNADYGGGLRAVMPTSL